MKKNQRIVKLNMPQMAVGGLSEQWFFKEIGDFHWAMLCEALQCESHNIIDSVNNRLYPTFVRIRWEANQHLKEFHENDTFLFNGHLSRFGKSILFNDFSINAGRDLIKASLMTTFAVRGPNNKNLLKGEPTIPISSQITEHQAMPLFGEEYREMRKGEKPTHTLKGESFVLSQDQIFECSYRINPYLDLNGVNLLYFAAYPLINDTCERDFIHQNKLKFGIKRDWALESSTVARDIFYFGNCDAEDAISFRINAIEVTGPNKIKLISSLYREFDNHLLATLYTVKVLHG